MRRRTLEAGPTGFQPGEYGIDVDAIHVKKKFDGFVADGQEAHLGLVVRVNVVFMHGHSVAHVGLIGKFAGIFTDFWRLGQPYPPYFL
jgi:glyoxylase-like metal-dependent hydrolase (beta-lactamase superfamily II)